MESQQLKDMLVRMSAIEQTLTQLQVSLGRIEERGIIQQRITGAIGIVVVTGIVSLVFKLLMA